MALTSYTELKAAVADFANRTDLTTPIVDCITLAEARLYDMLLLKDMETDSPLTLTIGRNYVALPTGFISPVAYWIVVSSQRVPLTPVLPQELPYDTTNSQPRLWAIDGVNLRFDCPVDANYSSFLRCYIKSNLGGAITTNYLLARRPDIYLAGALAELGRYTRDADLFAMWESKFVKACAEMKSAENRARANVPLRTDMGRRVSNILTG